MSFDRYTISWDPAPRRDISAAVLVRRRTKTDPYTKWVLEENPSPAIPYTTDAFRAAIARIRERETTFAPMNHLRVPQGSLLHRLCTYFGVPTDPYGSPPAQALPKGHPNRPASPSQP